MDDDSPDQAPVVAVAAGAELLIYKNLRPFYKYVPFTMHAVEC